jgi:dihydrofolate reductase
MPSLVETLKYCNERKFSQVWIMGGEFLYKTALNNVDIDNIYITRIDNDFTCDTFFPIVPSYFHLESRTEWLKEKETRYRFEKYIYIFKD